MQKILLQSLLNNYAAHLQLAKDRLSCHVDKVDMKIIERMLEPLRQNIESDQKLFSVFGDKQ